MENYRTISSNMKQNDRALTAVKIVQAVVYNALSIVAEIAKLQRANINWEFWRSYCCNHTSRPYHTDGTLPKCGQGTAPNKEAQYHYKLNISRANY